MMFYIYTVDKHEWTYHGDSEYELERRESSNISWESLFVSWAWHFYAIQLDTPWCWPCKPWTTARKWLWRTSWRWSMSEDSAIRRNLAFSESQSPDPTKVANWLVVCNMTFVFPYFGNVIIPIDELIFFRGVAQPPTNQISNWDEWRNCDSFKRHADELAFCQWTHPLFREDLLLVLRYDSPKK